MAREGDKAGRYQQLWARGERAPGRQSPWEVRVDGHLQRLLREGRFGKEMKPMPSLGTFMKEIAAVKHYVRLCMSVCYAMQLYVHLYIYVLYWTCMLAPAKLPIINGHYRQQWRSKSPYICTPVTLTKRPITPCFTFMKTGR